MPVTEKQIAELELFFTKAKLPATVQLDPGTKINDVAKFIASHLKVLRNNGDNTIYEVFYERLVKLKELIS